MMAICELVSSILSQNQLDIRKDTKQVWQQLLSLLQQYPNGLTEAVILTQLKNGVRHKGQAQEDSGGNTAAKLQLLSQCLHHFNESAAHVAFAASISAVEDIAASTASSSTDISSTTSIPILQLDDGSMQKPMAMFVHSARRCLLQGSPPLLQGKAASCDGDAMLALCLVCWSMALQLHTAGSMVVSQCSLLNPP
eukprot:jgi/Chrzof1/4715/Cz14g23250.t1